MHIYIFYKKIPISLYVGQIIIHFLLYLSCNSIESYSCKMAGNDKRLFKTLNEENREAPGGLQALSPPQAQGYALYGSSGPNECVL